MVRSSIFKLKMTELISKLCYLEYAQIKATRLECVNAIDKLNYDERQSATPPMLDFLSCVTISEKQK